MPEDELIEIDLQLATAHTVVGADQPLLEVSDRTIGERGRGACAFAQVDLQRLLASNVPVTRFGEACEPRHLVSVDRRPLGHERLRG